MVTGIGPRQRAPLEGEDTRTRRQPQVRHPPAPHTLHSTQHHVALVAPCCPPRRTGLAGVDPTDHAAAAAGLPPIDSFDLWPLLSGANTTAPRTELLIGLGPDIMPGSNVTTVQSIIVPPHKLIIGPVREVTVETAHSTL